MQNIGEMFDFAISQEWNNIKIIMTNDERTDGVREFITAYKPQFSEYGHEVVLIDWENPGICAAAGSGIAKECKERESNGC